jgi:elongation factor 1-alpha
MNKELTLCTLGSVDSGKSTIIGTILSGKNDDGNGSNRKLVSRFKHEITSGKTSAISTHSIKNFNKTDKSLIFVDLCGHEKYLRTTLFGIMGYHPDYAIVIIGANRGILKMTREHIKILYHLKIPMIFVITKTDLIDKLHEGAENKKDGLAKITNDVKKIFKKGNFNVLDMNDIIENDKSTTGIIANEKTIPLFKLSCKTGYGLDYFKDYLKSLPKRIDMKLNKEILPIIDIPSQIQSKTSNDFIFQIETIYCPPGIGWVTTGILRSTSDDGFITPNSNMYLGPGKYNGEYLQVKVWSIFNYFNEKVDKLFCGQRGCLAVRGDKKLTREYFRKGSLLTNNLDIIKKASYTYRAKIKLLNHPTNVKDNFTPVIHSGTIRQSARLTIVNKEISLKKTDNKDTNDKDKDTNDKDKDTNDKDKDNKEKEVKDEETKKCIYPGDTAIIEVKFMYRPEIVESGQVFFMREGLTLGIGSFL